ncbi:hypothetical protein BGZ91_002884, partial [Linnemannia elongata]
LQQHQPKVPARFLLLQRLGPVASCPVGSFLPAPAPAERLTADLVPHEVSSPL